MLPAVALIALSLGQPIPVSIPTPIVTPKVSELPAGEKPKPQEFTARVGELKRFAGGSDKAKWELAAGTVGADLVADGKGGCVFSAEAKGRYTLICYTEGPAAWVVVTVGDSPAPPAPVPVPPTPVPPTPPAPVPVPPAPPKPLSPGAEKLKAAVEKDGGFTDANQKSLVQLTALVSAAIDAMKNAKFTDEYAEKLKEAGETLLAKGELPTARAWLNAEFKRIFGNERRFITDDLRKQFEEELAKLHGTMKEVSGK